MARHYSSVRIIRLSGSPGSRERTFKILAANGNMDCRDGTRWLVVLAVRHTPRTQQSVVGEGNDGTSGRCTISPESSRRTAGLETFMISGRREAQLPKLLFSKSRYSAAEPDDSEHAVWY